MDSNHTLSSSTANVSDLLTSLKRASKKSDVKNLIDSHGYERVSQAWNDLDGLTRSTLQLMKAFDGVVIHGSERQPDSVRDE